MTEWDLAYMRRRVQPTDNDSLVLRLTGRAKFLREGACYKSAELMEQAAAALAAQPLHEQLREMGEAHAAQPAPVPKPVPVAWGAASADGKIYIVWHERTHACTIPLYTHPAAPVPVPVPLTPRPMC
jgi:hypothetical protein